MFSLLKKCAPRLSRFGIGDELRPLGHEIALEIPDEPDSVAVVHFDALLPDSIDAVNVFFADFSPLL